MSFHFSHMCSSFEIHGNLENRGQATSESLFKPRECLNSKPKVSEFQAKLEDVCEFSKPSSRVSVNSKPSSRVLFEKLNYFIYDF